MNFITYKFWLTLMIFLSVVTIVKYIGRGHLRNGTYDKYFLFIISLTLFGMEDLISLYIFLGINSWILLWIYFFQNREPEPIDKWIVAFILIVAFVPLVFFKYQFFIFGGNEDMNLIEEILIPVGISFYTFQMIGLLIDSLKEKHKISLIDLLNFASFFPQIVAGPIERRSDLLPQLSKFKFHWNNTNISRGLDFVILGLFYKLVVADNLSESTDWIYNPMDYALAIHLSNILFGLRIYFDFCGYTLVALGLATMFGIRLTNNFISPYCATNIRDFWRRWHISLSNWFRDYVYIPLGGSKARFPLFGVVVVFVISGVWHGAGWNFIFWGLFHVLMIVVQAFCYKKFKLAKFSAWLTTIFFISISWLFFYQFNSQILFDKLLTLIKPSAYTMNPLEAMLKAIGSYGEMAHMLIALILGTLVIFAEWRSLKVSSSPYNYAKSNVKLSLMVITIILFAPIVNNGFIYFNF